MKNQKENRSNCKFINWFKKPKVGIQAAIIGGLFVLIAAIIQSPKDNTVIVVKFAPTDTPEINITFTAEAKLTELALTFTRTPLVTPSPSLTPTIFNTETATPTPTPIFQEFFLSNNNGWDLPSSSPNSSYSASGEIIGGKLKYSLDCSDDYAPNCENWLQIPHVSVKDFDLAFDVKVVETTSGTPINIGVRFRSTGGSSYTILFDNERIVSMELYNGSSGYIFQNVFSQNINQVDEGNVFRIVAKDSSFIIYANGQEVKSSEDGNLNSKGSVFIGLFVPRSKYGRHANVEIDNIVISDAP